MEEELLLRYLNGAATDDEVNAVEQWLSLSPDNLRLLEQLYVTLEVGKVSSVFRNSNTEKALAVCKDRIHRRQKTKRFKTALHQLQRVAAILFVPVLLLSGYLYYRYEASGLGFVTMTTASGMISSFELPDGSKVWLNANSSLKYPVRFASQERLVELEGEAYFEVTKETDRHFKVKAADDYMVEVLGTRFDVTAYKNENNIETALVEGSVMIRTNPSGHVAQELLLKPGQLVTFSKQTGKLALTETHPENVSSWRMGKIVFKNQPMERVLKTLQRHYNVSFDVKNAKIYDSRITAAFENEKLVQVLDYLKLSSNLKYKIVENSLASNDTLKIYKIELDQ